MKKIPSLYQRDWNGDRSRVTNEVNPVCRWVFNEPCIATRKFDGTAVMVRDGVLYCRFDAKNGKRPPVNFEPAQPEPDPETGHWPGWVPAGNDPQYKWQRAAFDFSVEHALLSGDGTYEACGPHFQGNPEGFAKDVLVRHGVEVLSDAPMYHEELKEYFLSHDIEGIVWHHADGRMAKIKASDFGVKREKQRG